MQARQQRPPVYYTRAMRSVAHWELAHTLRSPAEQCEKQASAWRSESVAIGSLYRPMLEAARRSGRDIAPVLARLGLSEALLLAPNARLSEPQGRALLRGLVKLTGDRTLGLRAVEEFALGDTDLIGYLVRNAPHPLAALDLFARYSRLLGDTAAFDVEREHGLVVLSFRLRGGRLLEPEGADFAAGAGVHVLRELSRGQALPLEVRLARPRPREPAHYRRFFAAPVLFNAACTALVYAEPPLLVPFPQSDRRLLRILEDRASEIAAALPAATGWLDGVRAEIDRTLATGGLELAELAQRCGMSERTLRRRLAAAHSSYRALVDEVRRERALMLLHAGPPRITELAQQLGYSDAGAFARAFRRWTGRSPQTYARGG
jgi:AraC-like DNA-binding protein